jgi:hypothetical protein
VTAIFFKGGTILKISGIWIGVIAIVLGILVLALPELIRWFIGIGLIVIGILALVRK